MATEAWMCWLCDASGNGTPPAVCPGCGADASARVKVAMEFDYLIAGGGSAGCVLAARLSEDPAVSVGLIEAGGSGTGFMIRAPAMVAAMVSGRPKINNWAFTTEPQPGLGGRRGFQPRGRGLGGSSAINAMLYIRGQPQDYDAWAEAGAEGWEWDACLPHFLRAERNLRGAGPFHGGDGPLQVADQSDPRPITGAFVDACAACQIPGNPDFNGPAQEGAGLYQVTQFFDGPRKGTTEVVIADLPGYPDNINRASDGTYWLALVGIRTPAFDLALRKPGFRKRMAERVAPDEWLFPNMNYGCVVKFDETGRIVDCLWDRHGANHPMITSMREDRGWLYLGGVSNNRIGRYRIPGADPEWTAAASYCGEKP